MLNNFFYLLQYRMIRFLHWFILTYLTSSCWVWCGWSFRDLGNRDIKGIKETQKLKLGDSQGIPRKYFKKSQASKLGDAPVGIPPFFFNIYRLVSVEPKFLLLHMMSDVLEVSFYFALLAALIKYIRYEILKWERVFT